jgi:ABC-type multidrug transport system fused ATPase/permease subunit
MTDERPADEFRGDPASDVDGPPPDETAPAPAEVPSSLPEEQPIAKPDATASPDDVVFVRNVSRAFDKRTVVHHIDLAVKKGTILGVIGPSGSGKTTTIRMITGALQPTSGEISVLGERPTKFRRSTRERIGYMPQLFTLYPDLTGRENVDFVASLFGLLWPRRRRRI